MAYDYRKAVLSDLEELIRENKEEILEAVGADSLEEADRDDLAEHIRDIAWADDSITGNTSESYFISTYKSAEALLGNDNLVAEALEEFCNEVKLGEVPDHNKGEKSVSAEYLDVTVRCYMLSEVMDEAIQNVIDSPDRQVAEYDGLDSISENYEQYDYRYEVRNEITDYINENLEELVDELSEKGYTADEVTDGLDTILYEKITEGEVDLPSASDREILHNIEEAFENDTLSGCEYKVADYFGDKEVETAVKNCYTEMVALEEKYDAIEKVSDKVGELLEQKEADREDIELD